jgi:hypothetical protein
MEKRSKKTCKRLLNGKNRGFSLLVVLVISMIALALTGALLQVSTNSAGVGRSNSAKDVKYNILQGGIEQGKAELGRIVKNADEIPKYTDKYGGAEPTEIASVATLLIEKGEVVTETWTKSRLGRLGIAGDSATFKVRIYDMQYKPELVPSVDSGKITLKEMGLLPPSMTVSGGVPSGSDGTVWDPDDDGTIPGSGGGSSTNAGVYLIRASLEIGGRDYLLDSAVIQSNNS